MLVNSVWWAACWLDSACSVATECLELWVLWFKCVCVLGSREPEEYWWLLAVSSEQRLRWVSQVYCNGKREEGNLQWKVLGGVQEATWTKHSEFLQSTETKPNQRCKLLSHGECKVANNSAALAQEIDLFSIRKETDWCLEITREPSSTFQSISDWEC